MSNNRVEVHVGAKTSELKKSMNEAESIVKDTAQEIEVTGKKVDFQIDVSGVQKTFDNLSSNISTQMLGLGKKIAAGIGSALAVDGLVSFTRNAISTASEVQKMSDLVGDSVEDFQYFAKGAETAGLSLEQFGQMGKDALDRLGEARRGEGEMMDFFEKVAPKIGVTIDMFKDLSGPEVIQAYYDGLEKANLSHAETITYMEQIVNDGSLLIPLLKDGGAGFKKWGEEAKNAGAIMSKDMVNNLGKAKENLYTLELQFQGFQAMLINSVTPAVTAIAQNFDNIKAVVIALGAAISAKLVVQCAVLAKEFVIGVAQGMAYQMQLFALQGQAMRTATAMGVLRSASALLGGPAGLGMLAFQGLAAGAAFLYMKRSSDEAVPALSTQGKTVAQLREEYEKLDKAQQRVLTRQATADLSKAEQGFRKQEIALLGLVRALISHSDASETDKKTAKDLYDQYLQGKLNADQLATGINNLRTVEAKHKTGIDEKAAAVNKERKAVIDAQGVLKTYNDVVNQGTKDNKSHTDSINDKANALANLTAKQLEYVEASKMDGKKETYISMLEDQGFSRDKAEFYADKKAESGTDFYTPMPAAVKVSVEEDWKRAQAAEAREQAEKKAEDAKRRQAEFAEKNYKFTQQELKMLKEVADLSAKYKLDEIGAKYGIPENYLAGLMAQESKGNPNAVSPTGAVGYFQTTSAYRKDNNLSIDDSKNLPVIADIVAKNLAKAYEELGSWEAAIRSHNAGLAGSRQFEKTGRVNGSAARNKEVSNFAPSVGKWIAGLGGSSLKSKGLADPNSPEALLEYKKFEDKKVERAEEAEKKKLALQYKYADERKRIAIDLDNAIEEIENSKLSSDEKINAIVKAEQEAADKVKEIDIRELQRRIEENELIISSKQTLAQRIYEIEMAQLQALFDAGKVSNFEKVQREKDLEDKLTAIKRIGLEERLDLETQLGKLTGEIGGIQTATNDLGALDHQKQVSDISQPKKLDDAQLKDFEDKFGGLTSRMSGLWDKGIQAMLNGTLTWKSAMNAIFTELAAEFIQNMVTAPLKKYMASLGPRLAAKLGLIKAETAAEVAGQTAQTGAVVAGETAKTTATGVGVFARIGLKIMETIKSVMMSAWEAMAKTMASIPFPLNIALGAAAFAGVAGIVGKIASARGGYDIPAGVNPVTQLHEEEMVLPKQHANTIRALGKSLSSGGGIGGGGGSSEPPVYFSPTIQAWDSKDVKRFMKKHGRELAESLSSFNRNFGKP